MAPNSCCWLGPCGNGASLIVGRADSITGTVLLPDCSPLGTPLWQVSVGHVETKLGQRAQVLQNSLSYSQRPLVKEGFGNGECVHETFHLGKGNGLIFQFKV